MKSIFPPCTSERQHELILRIRQMRLEAEGVISLELEPVDRRELPARNPGAHIDLGQRNGVGVRQYSLCGHPRERGHWKVAVQRVSEDNGVSLLVHERLRTGDLVDAIGPRNKFPLESAQRYVFVAGGIGITPLLPMIHEAHRRGATWSLLYGGRSRACIAFTKEIAGLGDRVQLRPEDEYGPLHLDAIERSRPETLVYCCGPEPLLAAVEQYCANSQSGAPRFKRFAAKSPSPSVEHSFEVRLAKSGTTIAVRDSETLLQALERNGIQPPNSCRTGLCGACVTPVLDGVADHRDSVLSNDVRIRNETMAICVGRALTRRLVLDL